MVELNESQLGRVFHALSDETRRGMLSALAERERTVSELAEPFDMSLAAASKHIRVLEEAGLLRRDVVGRTHTCRIEPGPLASAHDWLSFYEGFWTNHLNALDRLLRQDDERRTANRKKRR